MDKKLLMTVSIIELFVALPLHIVLSGWVLTIFWGWYVVPFGLPTLSLYYGCGLSVLVTMLSAKYRQSFPQGEDATEYKITESGRRIGYYILSPLFYLLTGWIITWFA